MVSINLKRNSAQNSRIATKAGESKDFFLKIDTHSFSTKDV